MPVARAPLPSSRASVRREREREIVEATRALFDQRGMQDAPIEEIARAVGINKALIYRHFASKEELYVLTLTSYLTELAERLDETPGERERAGADGAASRVDAVARLERGWRCYTDFCLEYPAFVDCGLSLMRQPAAVLRESVSDSIWMRLGVGMAACLGRLSEILGAFDVEDPDFTANHLYTQTLGTMQLARIGIGVRAPRAGGVPEMFEIDPRRVQEACIADVLAAVGAVR